MVAIDANRTLVQFNESGADGDTTASLAMVKRDGSLDTSFGQSGIATPAVDLNRILTSERHGQFVAVGDDAKTLYWFNRNGSLRTGFGGDGATDVRYQGHPLTIESATFARNGDLLIVGNFNDADDVTDERRPWLLVRLKADGTIRTEYGQGGFVTLDQNAFIAGADSDGLPYYSRSVYTANGILETAEGAVYVSGHLAHRSNGSAEGNDVWITLRRVLAEGVIDRRATQQNHPASRLGSAYSSYSIGRPLLVSGDRVQISAFSAGLLRSITFDPRGRVATKQVSDPIGPSDLDAVRQSDDGSIFLIGDRIRRFDRALRLDENWGIAGAGTTDASDAGYRLDGADALLVFRDSPADEPAGSPRIARLNGHSPLADIQPGTAGQRDRLLLVRGTTGDDRIELSRQGNVLRIVINNAVVGTFANSAVDEIVVDAGDGDDQVQLLQLSASVFGGNGDDLLRADPTFQTPEGRSVTALYGQAGKDILIGGGETNAILAGGDGTDRIAGGPAADRIYGGDGNDRVDGGGGADQIFGGAGRDVLRGGDEPEPDPANWYWNYDFPDADTIDGGTGDDRIDGGGGFDELNGGRGRDILYGASGNDLMIGGAETDTLYGGPGDDRRLLSNDQDLFDGIEGSIWDELLQ